jgi:act minimal PKS acyl carrier protein
MANFALGDLKRIMLECAGEAETVDWGGGILDATFDDLGYDSISMLEAVGRIERECGVRIEDGKIAELRTPRDLIDHVNRLLLEAPSYAGGTG